LLSFVVILIGAVLFAATSPASYEYEASVIIDPLDLTVEAPTFSIEGEIELVNLPESAHPDNFVLHITLINDVREPVGIQLWDLDLPWVDGDDIDELHIQGRAEELQDLTVPAANFNGVGILETTLRIPDWVIRDDQQFNMVLTGDEGMELSGHGELSAYYESHEEYENGEIVLVVY